MHLHTDRYVPPSEYPNTVRMLQSQKPVVSIYGWFGMCLLNMCVSWRKTVWGVLSSRHTTSSCITLNHLEIWSSTGDLSAAVLWVTSKGNPFCSKPSSFYSFDGERGHKDNVIFWFKKTTFNQKANRDKQLKMKSGLQFQILFLTFQWDWVGNVNEPALTLRVVLKKRTVNFDDRFQNQATTEQWLSSGIVLTGTCGCFTVWICHNRQHFMWLSLQAPTTQIWSWVTSIPNILKL